MAGTTAFPAALDSHSGGNPYGFAVAANNLQTELVGTLTAAATTVTVISTTGFPTRGLATVDEETFSYTGTTADTFTGVTRGADGTTAVAHVSGSIVAQVPVAANHNDLAAAIVAAETKLGTGAGAPATNTVLRGTGAGASGWTTLTGIIVTNSAAQTVTSGAARVLAHNGETVDELGEHDTGTGIITLQQAGWYMVSLSVWWAAGTASNTAMSFALAGAEDLRVYENAAPTANAFVAVGSGIIRTTTSNVELTATAVVGTTRDTVANATFNQFRVRRLA